MVYPLKHEARTSVQIQMHVRRADLEEGAGRSYFPNAFSF